MNEQDFLELLEDVVECTPGAVKPEMALRDVPGWDSVAVIGLLSSVHRKTGKKISAANLTSCVTVADLHKLVLEQTQA